ncbi:MAG: thioredoxin-dependent thiol peroxidase [Propionibacteriaceae bacterium]|jgi:peroxiredoxin Q/BCP|nr:thioredoxin-dependent thiol peroxidase [Propionibacteriaceae bacterium]
MANLQAGDTAPEFSLPDSTNTPVSLRDYVGRKVIVYFYPAALTPGCTLEAVDFTSRQQAFADAGYDIVGISPDNPAKLAKFADAKDLSVTLLADPDRAVIEAYGAWGTKVLYGKKMEGIIRSTFVVAVDQDGVGHVELAEYNVRATGHVDRLAAKLDIA